MKRLTALVLLLLPWAVLGQSTTQEYRELAGTVVLNERILPVLKSGGEEYLLVVQPQEPGAQDLKSGSAVIVKGLVTTITEAGQPTRLLLRPYEVVVRGQTVPFKMLPDGTATPWD